jgi:hypothetical protein
MSEQANAKVASQPYFRGIRRHRVWCCYMSRMPCRGNESDAYVCQKVGGRITQISICILV